MEFTHAYPRAASISEVGTSLHIIEQSIKHGIKAPTKHVHPIHQSIHV